MLNVEDTVAVDTTGYDLAPPGVRSSSPGVVLAVISGPHVSYCVRLRLQLGTSLEMTVPAEKVALAGDARHH